MGDIGTITTRSDCRKKNESRPGLGYRASNLLYDHLTELKNRKDSPMHDVFI